MFETEIITYFSVRILEMSESSLGQYQEQVCESPMMNSHR